MRPIQVDEAPDAPAGAAFADLPLLPVVAVRPGRRRQVVVPLALVGTVAAGLVVAYLTRRPAVDPDAPRVGAEVIGMH